jgi:hypothetical protein
MITPHYHQKSTANFFPDKMRGGEAANENKKG